ncbi:MAG: methyltransferase [Clostridia bacterium]|nr:methyltransferase [Clostridia bacterium]
MCTLQPNERLDYVNENLRLIQKTDGLTFGTDAYLLSAMLRANPNQTAAELGGGTGIISLLCLTKNKARSVTIWEIQDAYAELCRRNGELNGLSDRLNVVCGDVRDAGAEICGGEVDMVFSNPPYMKAASGKDNAGNAMNIARREQCGTIWDFCQAASRLLKYGGRFYTVYRPERFADLVCAMRDAKLEPKRVLFVYPSLSAPPCLVLTEAKKGASSGLEIAPPLIIYADDAKRVYTPAMEQIYDTCSMAHLFRDK